MGSCGQPRRWNATECAEPEATERSSRCAMCSRVVGHGPGSICIEKVHDRNGQKMRPHQGQRVASATKSADSGGGLA
jgi:hypothetical protein